MSSLEIFRAVAAEQSVTRAARALQRAQSNVTTRVRQLEGDLGVALFDRNPRRMTLTEEGQRLLGYAEQLLALAEEARQAVRGDVPAGLLRVGSMESTAAVRLPAPLQRYHAAWPAVAVQLRTGTTMALVDDVLASRLDCALVAHPGTAPAREADMDELAPDLEGTFLFSESLVLALPAGHARPRRPADLQVRQLAAFAVGCTYRACAEAWLRQGDADGKPMRPLPVVEMPSYHAMLASVCAGDTAAIVPRSLLERHADAANLQTVPVRNVHTYLVRRAGYTTPALDALLRELRRA
nr:LysR substrate-binding domain-containing protein [Cupriavidus sp. AU9028]